MAESAFRGGVGIAEVVRRSRCCRRFVAELDELYVAVDAEIARIGAICLGGGACCKFDLVGHRLFLSGGELALLISHGPGDTARCRLRRCPYQLGPRCSAHQWRPLACRGFFCDPRVTDICRRTCEAYHGRIRRLHEVHHLPYLYVELTSAILQLLSDP